MARYKEVVNLRSVQVNGRARDRDRWGECESQRENTHTETDIYLKPVARYKEVVNPRSVQVNGRVRDRERETETDREREGGHSKGRE